VRGVPPALPNFVKALLLSGRRRAELARMRWEEISEGLWIIPPERVDRDRIGVAAPERRNLAPEAGSIYVMDRGYVELAPEMA
jgi:hypothetical protein